MILHFIKWRITSEQNHSQLNGGQLELNCTITGSVISTLPVIVQFNSSWPPSHRSAHMNNNHWSVSNLIISLNSITIKNFGEGLSVCMASKTIVIVPIRACKNVVNNAYMQILHAGNLVPNSLSVVQCNKDFEERRPLPNDTCDCRSAF